jgi:hypothetical protein
MLISRKKPVEREYELFIYLKLMDQTRGMNIQQHKKEQKEACIYMRNTYQFDTILMYILSTSATTDIICKQALCKTNVN